MQLELTDEQVANLRWLLEAIGGDSSVLPIAILTVLDKGWAATMLESIPRSTTSPAMTLDQARVLLGRFAADNATVEQLATVTALLNEHTATTARVLDALAKVGLAADDPNLIANAEHVYQAAMTTWARNPPTTPRDAVGPVKLTKTVEV